MKGSLLWTVYSSLDSESPTTARQGTDGSIKVKGSLLRTVYSSLDSGSPTTARQGEHITPYLEKL